MTRYKGLAGLVMLAGAVAFAAPAMTQEFTWDLPNEYAAGSLPGQAETDFAELLHDYSGGRIKIVHHFGGGLGYKSRDHLTAVEDRAVPLASTYTGTFIGTTPIWQFQSLPFLATNAAESKATVEVAQPWMDRMLAELNQFILMHAPWTPVGIWANKPIDSVEALQGLKIRTYDANSTQALQAAGAAPVQLSWADVVPALATGSIEAVITSDEGGMSAQFGEHLSHFTNLNFTMGLNTIHMNIDAFNDLPLELKTALMRAAHDAEERAWERSRERIAANIKAMGETGITYVPVEDVPEEVLRHLQDASASLLEEWRGTMGSEADIILAKYYLAIGRFE